MLIEFSVSNFRSFREKQTFSMVATSRLRLKQNKQKAKIDDEKFPDLLKVAAIYGPNASGKSNLIKAFSIVSDLIINQSDSNGKLLPVSSFRFDKKLRDDPSRFDIHFITEGKRYQFELALTNERIIEEKLSVFVKGNPQLLYSRIFNGTTEVYKFGDTLEGSEILHDAWSKLTSSKLLFIAQAVKNSSDELVQLKLPLSWLRNSMKATPTDMKDFVDIVHVLAHSYPEFKLNNTISSFLQELDVPVVDIEFEHVIGPNNEKLSFESISKLDEKSQRDSLKMMMDSKKTKLTHRTELGAEIFDLDEESEGTKNLLGFTLPWLMMKTCSPSVDTFTIDELDNSLHPKIVASLVKKLIDSEDSAQLIFTTHDTHLMDTKILRRDQLWITERDRNGATILRSVHDFDGRESEDVEKRYFEGRYRGLPFVK